MNMFLIKKIISPFFFPLSFSIELSILGFLFIWFSKKKKSGLFLIFLGVFCLSAFSYDYVADLLLKPLETKYPPIISVSKYQNIKWIVVLGGGHSSDPSLPVISQLSEESMVRLIEAVMLQKKIQGSKIILSGGNVFDPIPHAIILKKACLALGMKPTDLLLEDKSKDTKDEALFVKNMVDAKPFILVTSASHMPRSVALFKKQGMKPIPAPVGNLVKKRQEINPGMFFPNIYALRKSQRAVHEYMGIVWGKIRGQI